MWKSWRTPLFLALQLPTAQLNLSTMKSIHHFNLRRYAQISSKWLGWFWSVFHCGTKRLIFPAAAKDMAAGIKQKVPWKMLRVHFAGEDGIDTGGMAQEFLANSIKEIGREFSLMVPPLIPCYTFIMVFFLACGQIVAVSLIRGGPPPQFLNDISYNLLVNPQQDLSDLQPDVHLTDHERAILTQVSKDPITHQDDILQYGYTGIIDTDHVHDLTGTVMVSLVSRGCCFWTSSNEGLNYLV